MKKIRLIIYIILVSFFLNFAWEFLQSPFYDCFKNTLESNYKHYLLAIIGDSAYTVLIYFILSIINMDSLWAENSFNMKNLYISIVIWLILAIFIEYKWVFLLNKWDYSDLMPVFLGIWIIPLIQMMILPLMSFKISVIFLNYKPEKIKNKF